MSEHFLCSRLVAAAAHLLFPLWMAAPQMSQCRCYASFCSRGSVLFRERWVQEHVILSFHYGCFWHVLARSQLPQVRAQALSHGTTKALIPRGTLDAFPWVTIRAKKR